MGKGDSGSTEKQMMGSVSHGFCVWDALLQRLYIVDGQVQTEQIKSCVETDRH